MGAPSLGGPGPELGAPTVPAQAGNRSTPWAGTLPIGKEPPASSRPDLAVQLGARPGPRPPLLGLGLGLALGWRVGLGGRGTMPVPNSSEVEVTTE